MIQTRDVGERNYQAGTRSFDHPVLAQAQSAYVSFTRVNWPNPEMADLLTLMMEVSADGVTWQERARATFPGGTITDQETGQSVTLAELRVTWSVPKQWRVRATAINRSALRTAVHLELSDGVN